MAKKITTSQEQQPTESKGTRQSYNVSAAAFIEAWETCNSADEVAEKLGMPKPIVHARASTYRQAGIKLKKMPRSTKNMVDVEAMNRLIEEIHARKSTGETRRKGPHS
jgi:hypothetical protein